MLANVYKSLRWCIEHALLSGCENYEPDATKTTVTYDNAGLNPLQVGSNKTLLGKGSSAGIRGKGLYLSSSNNVIIQNIKIGAFAPSASSCTQSLMLCFS